MKSKKTNINQKTVHIDKKVVKNVKKSQNTSKKDVKEPKMYTEDQICRIACMVFMWESQMIRICSAANVFLGGELSKTDFLKEYVDVVCTFRKLSKEFNSEIESTIGKFKFAVGGLQTKANANPNVKK